MMMLNAPIKGVLINRRMPMTLLSEGWMTLHCGWTTVRGSFGTIVCDPTGQKDLCYREGAISYMPQSMMCCQHENVSQPTPGGSQAEGGYKSAMTHIKAKIKTKQWCNHEPTTDTGVAPADTEDVVPKVHIHGNVQLSGKDNQFQPSDNDTSQLEKSIMTATGGLNELTQELAVRPPSGQSCGVSISAKPC